MTDLHLGRPVAYATQYDPGLLQALPRSTGQRPPAGRVAQMRGYDLWRAWEFSWLDPLGIPHPCVLELTVPADSPSIVESKSLKLYLFGVGGRVVADEGELLQLVSSDLEQRLGTTASLRLLELADTRLTEPVLLEGECIDRVAPDGRDSQPDACCVVSVPQPGVSGRYVCNTFRSLCPVTGQPDWATIQIELIGAEIDRARLHRYLLAYREHRGFHEQCVERIYGDLEERCQPERLRVTGFFLRRGGIDINPVRFSEGFAPGPLPRLVRQ